jgi:hypothetical protein
MGYEPSDSDLAYNRRHFSDEARAERKAWCDAQAAHEQAIMEAEIAEWEAFKASNPWPTDPTALRGHRMGLQEWIRERGD